MNITAESYGHAVMLILSGELTVDSLSTFQKAVDHQLAGKEVADLVLNLEAVPFIDSAGLEYLLDTQETLSARTGQIRLVKCDDNVKKILEITGLASTFEQCEKVDEALKAVDA